MTLAKKKALAQRTLEIGKDRIVFVPERIEEIKRAITKQDIRDLIKEGAILVKEKKGRKTVQRRKRKRGFGNIRKKATHKKRKYATIARKLRAIITSLLRQKKISQEQYQNLRRKIRMHVFKSQAQFKEYLGGNI